MSKFLRYALDTWLLPPLFFILAASIPLIIAIFRGPDGFTFMASLCLGVVGCILGFAAHAVLKSTLDRP